MLLSICCHYIVDTCYKHLQTASSCNCNSYVYAPGLRFASVKAGCEIWEAVFFSHMMVTIIVIIVIKTIKIHQNTCWCFLKQADMHNQMP